MENVSVFIKIRVLFWPEISALGVFFNFDNERMRPPKYPSVPLGLYCTLNTLKICLIPFCWFVVEPSL